MNEDYLWDKTGTDPEIERLEKALSLFRANESAGFQTGFAAEPQKPSTNIFAFRFAFPAFAAVIAAIALGLGLQSIVFDSRQKILRAAAGAQVVLRIENHSADKADPETFEKSTVPLNVKTAEFIPRPNKRKKLNFIQAKKLEPSVKDEKIRPDPAIVVLTAEERHAYEQLMLALSITSDKLKMVKDKAQSSPAKDQNVIQKKDDPKRRN